MQITRGANQGEQCSFCDGVGGWIDEVAQQSIICPWCHPMAAEDATQKLYLPTWDPTWPMLPAKWVGPQRQHAPWLVVMHSGAQGSAVAEYFSKPSDGRKVSAHLAWSKAHNRLVQCAPFYRVAWHAGGSTYKGCKNINFLSIGIEGPGPAGKKWSDHELRDLRESLAKLRVILPSLREIVRHSQIDPNKHDPGDGLPNSALEGLGYEVCTSV